MARSFRDASEFLEYLRKKAAPLPRGKRDTGFDSITLTQLDSMISKVLHGDHSSRPEEQPVIREDAERLRRTLDGWTVSPDDHSGTSQYIMEGLVETVIPVLPQEIKAMVPEQLTFGAVDSRYINASVARSSDGKYAVVMNEGLMLYLNKSYKLLAAEIDPKCVMYCNRGPVSELTSSDYASFREELAESYLTDHVPRGALVKLDHEATGRYGGMLMVAELFVLCHELGHLINGDLTDDRKMMSLNDDCSISFLIEGREHEIEHAADITGFGLLRTAHSAVTSRKILDFHLLLAVNTLFDLWGAIELAASSSHPSAFDRIVHIAEKHFGAAMARRIKDSYEDGSVLSFPTET